MKGEITAETYRPTSAKNSTGAFAQFSPIDEALCHQICQSRITLPRSGIRNCSIMEKYSGPSRICPRAAGSNLRWSAMRWVIGYELHRIRNDACYSSLSGQAGFRAYSRQAREDRASIISGSTSVMTTITADLDFASNFRLNRSFRHQIQARFIEERIPMRFWQKFKSGIKS